MLVDELLVLDVDEWGEEGGGGEEQCQAPGWGDLDQEVRDEGCQEGLSKTVSILATDEECIVNYVHQ